MESIQRDLDADGNFDASAAHICDECGHPVATTWHDHTFVYGLGEAAAELAVRLPVRRCDHCDFDYLDEEGERLKHEAVCQHLGILTPQEIRGMRERLGLSRSALAKLTRIGEASLSRWESGIKIQTPGYDRYLRLLGAPGIAAVLEQLEHAPLATRSRHAKFRSLEVSQRHKQRAAAFRLRPVHGCCLLGPPSAAGATARCPRRTSCGTRTASCG